MGFYSEFLPQSDTKEHKGPKTKEMEMTDMY